jgi:DNA-binding MarR family transcriptional regulator
MNRASPRSGTREDGEATEPPAGQVGLGGALRRAWVGYQRRLDEQLAAAGFDDRRFPDGRVLRICSNSKEATISQIGRQLGITRQGASKIVASLRDRRYVTVSASTTSGREKLVRLTPRAIEYLATQRKAARGIERELQAELGTEVFDGLHRLLETLGGDEQPRMSDYLRTRSNLDGPASPGD